MIIGNWAVIINMISIMALGVILSVWVVSLYFKFNSEALKQSNYSAKTYQKILWSIVILPWLMGLSAAIVLVFFDSVLINLQNIIPHIHWHHINEFDFFSWHGVLGVFVVVFTATKLTKVIIGLIHSINKIKILVSMAKFRKPHFFLLETDSPMAFTGGYFQPKVFVTSELENLLSAEELDIVLLHEIQHVRNKDPLKKLVFQILSSVFPNKTSTKLKLSMNLTLEQCADHGVTQKIPDKSKIAETLLKVNAAFKKSRQSAQLNFDESNVCHYGIDEIEHRIRYLLNNKPKNKYPVYLIFSLSILLVISNVYFAASVHHFIEYSLSNLSNLSKFG